MPLAFARFRSRITIAAIIAIAAAVYFAFFYEPRVAEEAKQSQRNANHSHRDSTGRRLDLVEMRTLATNPQAGLKARLLLRIRKQFDLSIRIFIPTLRKSIFDMIDIAQPVRQIKALRATMSTSGYSAHQLDTEAILWEEVKISSFTMLFVSTYVLCALTTVLKVQLHVLARAILRGEGPALESLGATPDNAEDAVIYARDSALLRSLIDGTFRTMFSSGLQRFADEIRGKLHVILRDWIVKERMRVDFEDMLQLLNLIRRDFENDFDPMIRNLFYDENGESVIAVSPREGEYGSSSSTTNKRSVHNGNRKEDPRADRLLRQIRQVLDNPLFSIVYRESVDAAFRMVIDNLRRFVFLSSDSYRANNVAVSNNATTNGNNSFSAVSANDSSNNTPNKRPQSSSPPTSLTTSSSSSFSSLHHASSFTSPLTLPVSPLGVSANTPSAGIARRASQTASPMTNTSSSPPPPSLYRTPTSSGSSSIIKKTPPLASILPQLKSLSARLLPETPESVNTYDLKSLTSGPLLESFCMTIFDAEDMLRVA